MKRSQLKKLIKEEILHSNASTIDLASKIRTLVYSTPFWKFRDAINMVIKVHYNRKVQLDEVRTDSKIWNDGSALAKELEEKGIAIKAYVEGTSSGALGKTKLYVATDGMTRDEFKQAIEQNYRKTPVSTSLSSEYYYSPKHKLYFFFYREGGNRGFHSGLDKMIDYDYTLLLKRRLPKR